MTQLTAQLWHIERVGDIHVVDFQYESLLDPLNIERFNRQMQRLVRTVDRPKIVISFANLRTFSSSVLSAIVHAYRRIKDCQGELRLAEIDDEFVNVFRISQIDRLIKIYGTTDEALADF